MSADFSTLAAFRALLQGAPGIDRAAQGAAEARNGQLTKPPGALGRLEDMAIWYAGWRGDPRPDIAAPQVIVPADHWQSAQSTGDWTLVSCTVSPGFQFEGFELAPPGFDIP